MASETSGPPEIDSTHSRTIAKAGGAATTAPNPTRLATANIGNTEALAPASMLARRAGRRRQLKMMSVRLAVASATATDQTPGDARERRAAPSALQPGMRNQDAAGSGMTSAVDAHND